MAKNHAMLWTVLGPGKKKYHLLCRCSCGNEREVLKYAIEKQTSKCCGHSRKDAITQHGLSGTSEHVCWHAMRARCNKPKHAGYPDYGGRGVKVCPEWDDPKTGFQAFLAYIGPKPGPKMDIDRFPNRDGNYEPGNVRWATKRENRMNRDDVRMFTLGNETLCLKDWAKRKNCSPSVLRYRVDVKGMPFEEAYTRPIQKNSRRKKNEGGAA